MINLTFKEKKEFYVLSLCNAVGAAFEPDEYEEMKEFIDEEIESATEERIDEYIAESIRAIIDLARNERNGEILFNAVKDVVTSLDTNFEE